MFTTKGEQPMWLPLFNALSRAQVNQTVTYRELTEAAGFDVRANRAPLYQAIRHLEKDLQCTAENVPGTGYRIIHAREHAAVGLKHQKKARRSVGRGLRKVNAADRSTLTQTEREALDTVTARLDSHASMLRNHSARIGRAENAIKEMREANAVKEALKLEQLRRDLEALGIKSIERAS